MISCQRCIVYEWGTDPTFLLPLIVPEATFIPAKPGETHADLLGRLSERVRTFVFHVNLTDASRVPLERDLLCRELRRREVRVFNVGVPTIAKSVVQRTCQAVGLPSTLATRDGDPDELLLAKTDRNHYGASELQLTDADARALNVTRYSTLSSYVRLPRRVMPDFLWSAPDVVIERWIHTPSDSYYRVYLLGSREVVCRFRNARRIKKLGSSTPEAFWYLDGDLLRASEADQNPPPGLLDTIRRFRGAFKMDFGALDILEDEHESCYVIDANSTPIFVRLRARVDILNFLREGLAWNA